MGLYEEPMDEDPSEETLGDLLGGDVFVEGFDPPDEDDELTVADGEDRWSQRDRAIDEWAEKEGAGSGPLTGGGWNTLPFGEPGECEDRLFVDVRRWEDIAPRLAETLAHLKSCGNTRYVVFHVGGDIGYGDWRRALNSAVYGLEEAAPGAKFVTRLAWNWTPRLGQRPYRWGGGICKGNTDNGKPVKLKARNRARFKHRIWFLEELGLLALDCAYIDRYTNQPRQSASGVSAVTFGSVQRNGVIAAEKWRVRIYLPTTVTSNDPDLGFHRDLLHEDLIPAWNQFAVNGSAWTELDASDWLALIDDPHDWMNRSQLPDWR